jgi:uncharacterized damage-inducible protein DinB
MKAVLNEFMAYHLWANQQICAAVSTLDRSKWTSPLPGSFPSIHKTLLHIWDADSIWWQRCMQHEQVIIPSQNFMDDTPELIRRLLLQDEDWLRYASDLELTAPQQNFSYTNKKGEKFTQPLYQVLLHICNHGTYHRGQLVTMLRESGAAKIPQTDFVHWARS